MHEYIKTLKSGKIAIFADSVSLDCKYYLELTAKFCKDLTIILVLSMG